MPPIILAMHQRPVAFCVTIISIVLPLVWVLAPANGLLP